MDKKIVFLLLCGNLIQATSVDQCIDRIIDFSLLDYRARRIDIDRIGTRLDNEIRILSDIQFTCSTTINSVILGIDVRLNRDSFPSVQIWRPTGNSNYAFVPGSERFIFYTTENVSRTGVYDYPLEPPLEVEPGDLLAFSQPSQGSSSVRGYYINPVNFNSHSIGFDDQTADLSGSPINNNLVLVYPILTDKQCINSISSVNATFIKDKSLLISDSRRRERRQLLYPELKFSCNGSVTKWIYGAVDRNATGELPEIQIWRQTDTDTYTKQTFSHVSANETEPGTNIHEYYPETPLEFQEGDILGYFQPKEDDSQIVLYAQEESGLTNRVKGNVDIAPIAVIISELQEGGNDYPLISLEISIEQIITSTFNVVPSSTQSVTDETISSTASVTDENISYRPSITNRTISYTATDEIASYTASVTDETISTVGMISLPESTSSSLLSTNTKLTSSSTGKTSKPNSADNEVTSSPFLPAETNTPESGQVGIAVGISIAIIVLLFIIVIIIVAVFLLIKRNANRKQDGAFNSPIYHTPISMNTSRNIINHLYEAQDVKLDPRSTDILVNNSSGLYDEAVLTEEGITTEVFYSEAGMPLPNKVQKESQEIYSHYEMQENDTNKSVIQDVGDGISMDAFTNINYGLPTDTSVHIYNVSDRGYSTQWGVLVPTIDQRNKIGSVSDPQDSVYASLQEVQSTNLLPQENITFFIEEPIYWEPAVDKSAIYHQLSQKKYREIVYQQIEVTGDLGTGEFGSVYKGRWHSPGGPMNVAIKSLKQHSADEDRVRFLQEAAIMGQFHHPNVVKLHGVVTMKEPEMIILELMPNGDLRQYLHQISPIPGELVDTTVPSILLSFCHQIASGMEYLSKKHFIHRDLAARNILVADKGICKVADFGMSRDLQNDDYYISNAKKIPIKWTAPEALHYKRYSTASDVWSFGALLYEIWSMGHKPFEGHTNQECLRKVVSGYRLPPPPGCPRPMYEMMIQCWHPETSSRPTFVDLVADLSQPDFKLLQTDTDTCLGAHLDTALSLYPELHYTYMS